MGHQTRAFDNIRAAAGAIRANSPGDISVDIAGVDTSGSTLDIDVFVTTTTTDTIDYELNINDTGTGGEVTRSGTLVGGAGSLAGDTQTESVSFGIGDAAGGVITATIVAPEEYVPSQAQQSWGGVEDIQPGFTLTSCSSEVLSDGSLEVSYSIAPEDGAASQYVSTEIRVGGQTVFGSVDFVPQRGDGFTQTVPADRLPIGEQMPVEIGVGGDFSECGTVTVGGAATPNPVTISNATATADGSTLTVEADATVEGGGDSTVQLLATLGSGVSVGPATTTVSGTQTVELQGETDAAGEQTVTLEATVFSADGGDVISSDSADAGTVTFPAETQPSPPAGSCESIVSQYGDVMAEYGTPGEPFDSEANQAAFEAWQRGEIDAETQQALFRAWQQGCLVPATGGGSARAIAIGAGVVGLGYAVSRLL